MGSLKGKKILVTRAREQVEGLVELAERSGAELVIVPTISFTEPETWENVDRSISQIDSYDLMIFTSQNAVRFFFNRFKEKKGEVKIGKAKIISIGEKTLQEIQKWGLKVSLLPEHPHAQEEMIEAILNKIRLKDLKILLPRAEEAREILPEMLRMEGAQVEVVVCYRTVPSDEGKRIFQEQCLKTRIDWILFSSPSQVHAFMSLNPIESIRSWMNQNHTKLATIGRVTEGALLEYELTANLVSSKPSMESIFDGLEEYERGKHES